jgi:hypothetical protein
MGIKVTPENYPEIIEVYNAEGKTAAYDLIRSQYGIKNPTCVMKRLKQSAELSYDPETDHFEIKSHKEEEGIFLNLDDLCNHPSSKSEALLEQQESKSQAMEKIIHSLISDRLLGISKYITLDPISHRILIDQTSMQTDGYVVRIC